VAAPKLAPQLGVTRVGRVTGLDRTGIEVACAVRPLGHVLQVCQGKGFTWAAAQASALGEAAELLAAERPREVIFGSAEELSEHFEVWLPDDVSMATSPALAGPEVHQGWVRAQSPQGPVLIPASAVYCPPAEAPWIGPATTAWTSNGLGAGRTQLAAQRHALLEVLERGGLNLTLPDGWSEAELLARLRRCDLPLVAELQSRGFETFTFDCTPRGWKVPIVAALLFDTEHGPIPLTAGYACREHPLEAARAAIAEAAQSRATEIHGAREDVLIDRRSEGSGLLEVLKRARPRQTLSALRTLKSGAAIPLPRGARLAVIEHRGLPWHVARVFVRGLLPSELLQ
jgi:ribosomal protein S12 methylthiotransferase accessory factor